MHHVDEHVRAGIPPDAQVLGERSRTPRERSRDGSARADHFEQLRLQVRSASALFGEALPQEQCATQHSVPKQSLRHDVIPRHDAPGPQSAPFEPPPDVEPPDVEPPEVDPPEVEPPDVEPPLLPGSDGDAAPPPEGGVPMPGAVIAPLSQVPEVSRSVLS